MPKYEILMITTGSLSEQQNNEVVDKIIPVVKHNADCVVKPWGLKDLAYPIAHNDKGWYTQINFTSNIPSEVAEFNRLAKLDPNIIRCLIINLDKDYGARAINNKKKVKHANKTAQIFKKRQEALAAERERAEEVNQTVENATAMANNKTE